jgi:glyoxylase-like metal-dependent hydrolase (beta-lactamase superfamily II)
MKLGRFRLDIVSDGTFRLDGGAMFGIVPKMIWNKISPADEKNRILLAMDCLLVRFDDRVVLLESGIGSRWDEKERSIYAIERNGGVEASLKKLLLDRNSVTDVILSHLHFDHAGALIGKDASGNLYPTFPNARHHFQRGHYEWAVSTSGKDRASFRKEDFAILNDRDLVEFHEGNCTLWDGFDLFVSNGHTPLQQHALLSGGEGSLVFCADLIPTSGHLKPVYNMGFDNRPVDNTGEKLSLLEEAAEKGHMLYFYHDPKIKLIKVKKNPKGFEIDEKIPFS